MDTTTPGGPEEPSAEDDDGPLAPDASPDAIDEDGDDASPVCLRCFAPLEGSPTRCPNCGAAASRSAMLGPSAGGGVDVGGVPVRPGRPIPRRTLNVWTYLLVWILGLLFLPPLTDFNRARSAGFWAAHRFESRLQLPVVIGWTLLFGWLVLRESRRPPEAQSPDDAAPKAP